jgi:hypothetical protein
MGKTQKRFYPNSETVVFQVEPLRRRVELPLTGGRGRGILFPLT